MNAPNDPLARAERSVAHPRPFSDLPVTGLLWLINTALLHPRGFSLALHYETDLGGEPIGWSIEGDGTEPWKFAGDHVIDERFAAIEALLSEARNR